MATWKMQQTTGHRLFTRFNFFTFLVEETLPGVHTGDAPVVPIPGWAFLTAGNNLDHLILCFLQFDPANCGAKVLVGPGPTDSANPAGWDIWQIIPALVLKNALVALCDGRQNDKFVFIFQVCRWDEHCKQVLQNMLNIWKSTVPSSLLDSWLLVMEVHNAVDPNFYDFLDNLDLGFNLDFKNICHESIQDMLNWSQGLCFNQNNVIDTIDTHHCWCDEEADSHEDSGDSDSEEDGCLRLTLEVERKLTLEVERLTLELNIHKFGIFCSNKGAGSFKHTNAIAPAPSCSFCQTEDHTEDML